MPRVLCATDGRRRHRWRLAAGSASFFFRFLGAAQVQEDKDLIYTYMQ